MPPRDYYEQALLKALSRHIGYTTGAYAIFRIADIVLTFENEPSKYQFQLIQELLNRRLDSSGAIQEEYASEILNFGVALGLIERLSIGGSAGLSKFALAPAGLAYRSAYKLDLESFKRFLLTGLVVESDADAYVLLLEVLFSLQDKKDSPNYRSLFKDWTSEILEERSCWINRAFPNPILRERLAKRISWAKLSHKKEVTPHRVKDDFARHHATPRKGWTVALAHYDEKEDGLTPGGIELLHRLRGQRNRFFWLGPPEGTQEALRIPPEHRLGGPFAPSWNALRPMKKAQESEMIEEIMVSTVSFMEKAFPFLRLVHANQAPLDAVRPYIYFKESELGVRTDTDALLRDIFQERSDKFTVLSKRTGSLGYYQLRPLAKKW